MQGGGSSQTANGIQKRPQIFLRYENVIKHKTGVREEFCTAKYLVSAQMFAMNFCTAKYVLGGGTACSNPFRHTFCSCLKLDELCAWRREWRSPFRHGIVLGQKIVEFYDRFTTVLENSFIKA